VGVGAAQLQAHRLVADLHRVEVRPERPVRLGEEFLGRRLVLLRLVAGVLQTQAEAAVLPVGEPAGVGANHAASPHPQPSTAIRMSLAEYRVNATLPDR